MRITREVSPTLERWEKADLRIRPLIAEAMLEYRGRAEREGVEPEEVKVPSPFGLIVFKARHTPAGTVYRAIAEEE